MVRVRYPSKVIPPRLGGAVPRTRLFERLDAMTAAPCSWITAAPGAGKTTLVNSWSQSRRRPCLWYQFDQRDGDPATFFHYLRMAAARATASGDVCLPALTPEYLGGLPIFARNFFELLYRSLPENAVLIFDNYQDLPADSAVHALFALGLEAVVPSVKAVVVSRSDPPPEIARLRVNGLISQLSAGELNLSREEAREIITQRQGHLLSEDLIDGLLRKAGAGSLVSCCFSNRKTAATNRPEPKNTRRSGCSIISRGKS